MNTTKLNLALAAAAAAIVLVGLFLGSAPIGPLRALGASIGLGDPRDVLVVQAIRLPRALAAFVVGGSLALAGAALQGLLRNPLAEPGVLGVSASSILGATLVLYFGVAAPALTVPLASVAGGLAATALIAGAAMRIRSVGTLILFGIGLSSFIGASMSLVLSLAPTPFTLAEMVNWTFGSVTNRSWRDLGFAAPFLTLGAALLFRARRGLTLLSLGEDAAQASGLDLRRHRVLVVAGSGLLTGAAVSIAGGIGFVGLVAPHLVRPLTGHDPGASLLPSFLAGGVLLGAADLLLRIIPVGDLRLGVVTALVGAPVFIWIALQRRGV